MVYYFHIINASHSIKNFCYLKVHTSLKKCMPCLKRIAFSLVETCPFSKLCSQAKTRISDGKILVSFNRLTTNSVPQIFYHQKYRNESKPTEYWKKQMQINKVIQYDAKTILCLLQKGLISH